MKSPINAGSNSPFNSSALVQAGVEATDTATVRAATQTEQAVDRVLDQSGSPLSGERSEPLKASDKAALIRSDRAAEALERKQRSEELFMEQLNALTTLDWEDMPVPVLATLLMSKPFKGKRDEPDKYMSPKQALIYASSIKFLNAGCVDPQKKLNPFLNDVWPDLDTMKVNVTVEGQRKLASRRGDLGIPTWKEIKRPLANGAERKLPWQKEDIGYECSMPIGKEVCKATAWLSMWFKNTPIWRENWEHMLRVRSEGLCYETITGVGISQPHGDKEVENVAAYQPPAVEATNFVESPIQMNGEKQ
jgi:hypothetical protein